MPEINPYEAPQSEQLPIAETQLPEESGPAWLGRALWVQVAAILLVIFVAPIPFAPANQATWNTIVLGMVGMIFALTLVILVTALRYRIGWLLVLELIVLGLPIYAFVVSRF